MRDLHADRQEQKVRFPWHPMGKSARHGNGTNFSFADGHSEYWKWKDPRTISYGMMEVGSGPDQKGNEDLYRVQKAVWGKLGYSESPW